MLNNNKNVVLLKGMKGFIPALTGVRAVAVYFIFFKHYNPFATNTDGYLIVDQFFSFLSVFFVLSGFLICYRYYDSITGTNRNIYNYFINRIARVYPILIILISATFFLYWRKNIIDHESVKTYLYNISLLKGFSEIYILTGIGPSWSLTVEEVFYLISPIVFLSIKKPSGLVKFIMLMYGIAIVLTIFFMDKNVDGFFGSFAFTFGSTFFGRTFEFACGIYLALVLKGKFKYNIFSKCYSPTMLGAFIILITILFQFLIAKYVGQNATGLWLRICINNIILPIGITILFYGIIVEDNWFKKILSHKIMIQAGSATYSFYLLHTSFVASLISVYLSKNIFVIFVIMIFFSYFFYRIVEEPLAHFIRTRFSKKLGIE